MTPRLSWRAFTWIAVGLFAADRLPELTRYALWYDELFSLSLAQSSWGELLAAAVHDRTNPPLFYLLLKAWIGIGGESVAWMRLLPCLLGVAVAVPLVALVRATAVQLRDADAESPPAWAWVAVAAAASSPLAVFLSNELRAYSLTLCLAAWSLALFARRDRAWLIAVNVALVISHYFGWFVVGAECVAAAAWHRDRLRRTAITAAAAGVASVPWAVAVVRDAAGSAAPLRNVSWIATPGWLAVPRFYDALVARVLSPSLAPVGAAVVVALLVALLWWFLRRASPAERRLLLELKWFAASAVVAVFAASLVSGRAAFVPRYLMVAAPAWWILLGLGADAARRAIPRAARAVAAFGAVFVLTAGALREIRGGEKIAWDQIAQAAARDAGAAGGSVYAVEGFTALPMAYYAREAGATLRVVPVKPDSGLTAPGWLVLRAGGGAVRVDPALATTLIRSDSIPSQRIDLYRVAPR